MIKACVFDLDGTVLDTINSITYFVNVTLEKYKIRTISVDECKIFVGRGARILIERVFESRGVSDALLLEDVIRDYNAAYDKDPLYKTAPFEGIPELLSSLREMGIGIAVVSNKPEFITRPLVKHFFGDLVDVCFGGREDIPLKPAPDSTLKAISLLGARPEETVYVGDTGTDMKTGRAVGAARVIGVTWGFRGVEELLRDGSDIIVSHPDEIQREVRLLNA